MITLHLPLTTFSNFYLSSLNHMLMITGTDKKQSKIIVNTNQAFQVMMIVVVMTIEMMMIMMDKKQSKPGVQHSHVIFCDYQS